MLTVRMNWMDADRSQSTDVQLSKDSKDIPVYHRNKLYHHRAQVASVIRHQLAIIQREMSGDPNDSQTEEAKATEAISALIKGQRYRDGKLYTCYIDGTSHEGSEVVSAYNAYCRRRLDEFLIENKDVTAIVPDASEFDVTSIEALESEDTAVALDASFSAEEKRAHLRKKIDAARSQYNAKALKCSRYLTSFVGIRNAKLSEGFGIADASDQNESHPSTSNSSVHADGEDEPFGDEDDEDKVADVEEGADETPTTPVVDAEGGAEETAGAEEGGDENKISDFESGDDAPPLRDGTSALAATSSLCE